MKKSKLLSAILSFTMLFQVGAVLNVSANDDVVSVLTWEEAKERANTDSGNWEKTYGNLDVTLNEEEDYISFTGPASASRSVHVREFPLESEAADGVLVVSYSYYVPTSSKGISGSHIMELRESASKGKWEQTDAKTNGIGEIRVLESEAGMQFGEDEKNDISSSHPNRGTVGNGYYIPKDQWVKVKYIMDYNNDKGETNVVYSNKSGGAMDFTAKYDLTDDYLEYAPALMMYVKTTNGCEIRIKDLTVSRVGSFDAQITNDTEAINIAEPINIEFNQELQKTVTAEDIEICEIDEDNNEEVIPNSVSVRQADDNKSVAITVGDGGLKYGEKQYRVKITANLVSGSGVPLANTEWKITTKKYPGDIEADIELLGNTVNYEISGGPDTVKLMLICYDANGMIVGLPKIADVQKEEETGIISGQLEIEESSHIAKVKVFMLNGLNTWSTLQLPEEFDL